MSEREKLARVLHRACGNSFSEIVRLAIADVVLAAGYRLIAPEGPEFEAMMVRMADRLRISEAAATIGLRAALETGERDG